MRISSTNCIVFLVIKGEDATEELTAQTLASLRISDVKQDVKNQRHEILASPFPLADHSLEVADPTIYERLQTECAIARVRMPVGGKLSSFLQERVNI